MTLFWALFVFWNARLYDAGYSETLLKSELLLLVEYKRNGIGAIIELYYMALLNTV